MGSRPGRLVWDLQARLDRILAVSLAIVTPFCLAGCRKSMREAIESYDIEVIARLVEQGANVNAEDARGRTALHVAAVTGRPDVAQLLISKGADIDAGDNGGWTPLHAAAANGKWSTPVARLLVSHGADVRAATKDKTTVLHEVGRGGDASLAELVIKGGADVNAVNHSGNTPLHSVAVARNPGSREVARVLLDSGARVWVENKSGCTAVEEAVLAGNEEVAALLAHAVDLSAFDESGRTPLHYAVRRHHKGLVKVLLEQGAPVNAKDRQGDTPLDVAVMINDEGIVKILKEWGGKVTREHKRKKPTPRVTEAELLAELKRVVSEGGDVNVPYAWAMIPLHEAVLWGYSEAVGYLLSHGADPDVKTDQGSTALRLAAVHERADIAKQLIESGANVNVKDKKYGHTPLHLAVMAKQGSQEMVKLLIGAGARVNERSVFDGTTALHVGVNLGKMDIVRILLSADANIDSKTEYGQTPLHLAARQGNVEMVKLLLEEGAKVNAKDREGLTALDYALMEGDRGRDAGEVLREHGGKSSRWQAVK